jgi:hypothetical protein
MRTITSLLASLAVPALVLGATGCEQSSNDSLTPHEDYWATPAASDRNPAPSHNQELTGSGQNGITDLVVKKAEDAQMGTPDQVARMHGTTKIQYAMLGTFLSDLGVTMTASTAKATVPTAGTLYVQGESALGAPIYPSRTPEMLIPSTSALAKEYDVFMAAAPSILTNIGNSKRCAGVALVTAGQLTADGISCLIGKPSLPDHLTLANQIVSSASDPTTGQEIAVATLLAAAHISE